jgi:hypothetical protein
MALEIITLDNLDIKQGKLTFKSRSSLIKDVFNSFLESKNDKLNFKKVLKMFRQEYSKIKARLNQIIKLFIKKSRNKFYCLAPHEKTKQEFKNSFQKLKLINRNV